MFKAGEWRIKNQKYCSLPCANKARSGENNPSKREEVKYKISQSKKRAWADKRSMYHSMNRNWSKGSRMKMRILKTLPYATKWNFRKFALRNLPNNCKICGKKYKLVVHHIDENRGNNDIKNFVILCNSCHNVLHKFAYNVDHKKINMFLRLAKPLSNNQKEKEKKC